MNHTLGNDKPLSECHEAPTTLGGGTGDFRDDDRPVTMHYVCTYCHKACNLLVTSRKSSQNIANASNAES